VGRRRGAVGRAGALAAGPDRREHQRHPEPDQHDHHRKHYYGVARYVPIADTLGRDTKALEKGYDLHLMTNRDIRMTKSRTITHPYLTEHMPENAIVLNARDAKRLGLKSGQRVKVVSARA
jgi:anaerobic selenocysteine-containing dehydrogenase